MAAGGVTAQIAAMAPIGGMAAFGRRLRVMAALCPEGQVVTMSLTPEDARALAPLLERADRIARDGVLAIGVVQIDRPGVVGDLWLAAVTWTVITGAALADFLIDLAGWLW